MRRLALFLVALLAVFAVLHWAPFVPKHRARRDEVILAVIATAYALSTAFMVVVTQRWSVRALGLLGTMGGDALFWSLVLFQQLGRHTAEKDMLLDLVRACFLVGGPLVLYGWWLWWRGRDEGAPPRDGEARDRRLAALEEENRALRAALNGGEP